MAQPSLPQRLAHSPVFIAGVLAGAVFAALLVVRNAGLLQGMEMAGYDALLRSRVSPPRAAARVVLVRITEDDIQRLAAWPLSDQALDTLLQRIVDLGAAQVAVDIYRDHPVPPGSDVLARTLQETPQIVMAEKRGRQAGELIAAPPVLRGGDRVGFTDMVIDADGYVRRALLFMDDGKHVYYSMALRIAGRYLAAQGIHPQADALHPEWMQLGQTTYRPFEANDGSYVDADAAGYQYLLDYRYGADAFPRYDLGEVLDGRLPADALRGRIVVVGVDAESVKDRFLTPIRSGRDARQGLPGMQVHAHAITQLVDGALAPRGSPAVVTDRWEDAAVGLAALLGVLGGWWLRRLLVLVPVLLGGVLLLAVLSVQVFAAGTWLPLLPAALAWVLSGLLMSAWLSGHERHQKRFLMDLFARHVSRDVASEIWRQRDMFLEGGRLEPRKMPVTILFSDLENFTPVAEALDPEQLIDWLNGYMDTMARLVMTHGGVVDDYYGDAIKANFGVPAARTEAAAIAADARSAVACALAMRGALAALNGELSARGLPPVRMRIGIASGVVIAGCLGSTERMKYTTLGDPVNTAARLEAYGKEVDWQAGDNPACRIMIAAATRDLLADAYPLRHLGDLELKGKSAAVGVFTISEPRNDPATPGVSR